MVSLTTSGRKKEKMVSFIDEFAIRTIDAVASHGEISHLKACREVLCPLLRFIYGEKFVDLVGISGQQSLKERYHNLSRMELASPRTFLLVDVYNDVPSVKVDVTTANRCIRLSVSAKITIRRVQLMLTAMPQRSLKRKHDCESCFEIIDVNRVTHIRFLIWVGKQLTSCIDTSFSDIYQTMIFPILLLSDGAAAAHKSVDIHHIPLSQLRAQIL